MKMRRETWKRSGRRRHMEMGGVNLWQIDYVQTLGLGGWWASSADGFFRSFSFFFSCLITHCKLDRHAGYRSSCNEWQVSWNVNETSLPRLKKTHFYWIKILLTTHNANLFPLEDIQRPEYLPTTAYCWINSFWYLKKTFGAFQWH